MTTLEQLQDEHGVWLPRPKEWRKIKEPITGQINGIPTFRGMAVATNGIHVLIQTSANKPLIGHVEWFMTDKEEPLSRVVAAKPTKSTNISEIERLMQCKST